MKFHRRQIESLFIELHKTETRMVTTFNLCN